MHLRIGIEHSSARLFTGHRLILEQGSINPLLERGVDRADGNNQSGRFLHR